MKYVCIMGRSNSGKKTVLKTLKSIGFEHNISYTTREPRVINGKTEQNGEYYKFVTEEQFMNLVKNDKIVEYTRYKGALYGTKRPYGAKKFVSLIELNGYRKLKEIYKKQIIGVYLDCDYTISQKRGIRDGSEENFDIVYNNEYEKSLENMKAESDIVINSGRDLNNVIADILKKIKSMEDISEWKDVYSVTQ